MMADYYLAPAAVALRDQINAEWSRRDKASDGWIGDTSHAARLSDHNPDRTPGPGAEDGIVRAVDVDRDLVPGSLTQSLDVTEALVNRLVADDRVSYLIYRGRIWQNPRQWSRGGWLPYSGSNPHIQHFHVSIRHGEQWERDQSPWPVTPPTAGIGAKPTTPPRSEEDDMSPEQYDRLIRDMRSLIDTAVRDVVRQEVFEREVGGVPRLAATIWGYRGTLARDAWQMFVDTWNATRRIKQ